MSKYFEQKQTKSKIKSRNLFLKFPVEFKANATGI